MNKIVWGSPFQKAIMIVNTNNLDLQWKPILLKLSKGLKAFRAHWGTGWTSENSRIELS